MDYGFAQEKMRQGTQLFLHCQHIIHLQNESNTFNKIYLKYTVPWHKLLWFKVQILSQFLTFLWFKVQINSLPPQYIDNNILVCKRGIDLFTTRNHATMSGWSTNQLELQCMFKLYSSVCLLKFPFLEVQIYSTFDISNLESLTHSKFCHHIFSPVAYTYV